MSVLGLAAHYAAAETFAPPPSPHADYSFNSGWKFIREDVTNAEQVAFDDSKWIDVKRAAYLQRR